MRRTILFPAFFYLSGILIFIKAQEILRLSYCFLIITVLIALFLFLHKIYSMSLKQIGVLYICFFIGIINPLVSLHFNQKPFEKLYGHEHTYVLKVINQIKKDDFIKLVTRIEQIDNHKADCKGKLQVNLYSTKKVIEDYENKNDKGSFNRTRMNDQTYKMADQKSGMTNYTGTFIEVKLKLDKPQSRNNPHCFDYKRHLYSKGIFATASTYSISAVYEGNSFKQKILKARDGFLDRISDNMSEEYVAIIKGVCFGDKSDIDEDSLKEFQKNGTAHVLAVSGLHIGVIYLLIKKLLYKRNRLAFYITVILTLTVYGVMTMWAVSVIRASILIGISMLSFLFERRYDLTSGIISCALIILTIRPMEILDISFQMSFLAVLSLSFFSEHIQKLFMKKFDEEFSKTFASVISIQLGLGIFSAYIFNNFSFVTILLNIPVIFIVSYMVPFIFLQFIIFTTLGFVPAGKISELFCILLEGINRIGYAGGMFSVNIVSKSAVFTGFIILLLFFVASESFAVSFVRKEKYKLVCTVIIIAIVSIPLFLNVDDRFNKANAIFVDVGQGDCLHIRDKGNDYLIDGGGKLGTDIGEKLLRPYLLKNGAGKIDGAVATHNHTDHFLGLCQLSDEIRVRKFYISSGYVNIDEEIRRELDTRHLYYINNQHQIKISKSLQVEILWPDKDAIMNDEEDENAVSLVMMVHLKGKKILVTGDIDEECEKKLLTMYKGSGRLKCDILKVAHHGSKYSSHEEFLKETNPEIAVISVGKNNYGHPNSEVIERLEQNGCRVYRTDRNGAIGIIICEKEIQIISMIDYD